AGGRRVRGVRLGCAVGAVRAVFHGALRAWDVRGSGGERRPVPLPAVVRRAVHGGAGGDGAGADALGGGGFAPLRPARRRLVRRGRGPAGVLRRAGRGVGGARGAAVLVLRGGVGLPGGRLAARGVVVAGGSQDA